MVKIHFFLLVLVAAACLQCNDFSFTCAADTSIEVKRGGIAVSAASVLPTSAQALEPMDIDMLRHNQSILLYLNHIPKTGGSSLEAFVGEGRVPYLMKCGICLRPQQYIQDKLVPRHCRLANGNRSQTPIHCLHKHNPAFNEWRRVNHFRSFCFVRDPIDRFLSNYNMRASGCESGRIESYLRTKFMPSELDGHEINQTDFICDIPLCFEHLQTEFDRLLKDRRCDLKGLSTTLKHERSNPRKGKTCTRSDLNDKSVEILKNRYVDDELLYNKVCVKSIKNK